MSDLTHLILHRDLTALNAAFTAGTSPDEKDGYGRRAICLAAACGYADVVRALASAGADVNAPNGDDLGYTPLIEAAREGKPETVAALLDLGADIEGHDSRRGTALLAATIAAHEEVVGLLLDRGAEIDAADAQGQTPLHYLCRFAREWGGFVITTVVDGVERELPNPRFQQHTRVLETLLRRGADPNRLTSFGYTALHLAAESDAHEFIPLLVKAGADVNRVNAKRFAPLHAAADRGNVRAIERLLDAGAQVDAADELGLTPLIGAVLAREAEAVRVLLARGASVAVQVTGSYGGVLPGDTPLDVAAKSGADELVALLEEAGRQNE